MDMILKVFTVVGQSMTVSDAYAMLIGLNPNDPYAKEKAAGSLGGAVNGGTLELSGNIYTRIK